ncbi:MAG: hypothetical protein U0414_39205 [Polyangiaceae bacterium]
MRSDGWAILALATSCAPAQAPAPDACIGGQRIALGWRSAADDRRFDEAFHLVDVVGAPGHATYLHHGRGWDAFSVGFGRYKAVSVDAEEIVSGATEGWSNFWHGRDGAGRDHPIPHSMAQMDGPVSINYSPGERFVWTEGSPPMLRLVSAVETSPCVRWERALPGAPLLAVSRRVGREDHAALLALVDGRYVAHHVVATWLDGVLREESVEIPLDHLVPRADRLPTQPPTTSSAGFKSDERGIAHYAFLGYPKDAPGTLSLFEITFGGAPRVDVVPIAEGAFVVARAAYWVGERAEYARDPYLTWLALDASGALRAHLHPAESPIACRVEGLVEGAPFLSADGALALQREGAGVAVQCAAPSPTPDAVRLGPEPPLGDCVIGPTYEMDRYPIMNDAFVSRGSLRPGSTGPRTN